MTLGQAMSSGRTGNLDTLRLALAASVVVSHAWPLALGPGTAEPLSSLTGHSLGGWAVALFFFLSGLLVTASAERLTMRAFWVARFRRIVPGLGAALLVTLALALASGAAPGIAEASAWFARALTLFSIEHSLPGAFAGNPYPEVVNGPLWSLSHEVMAYAICAAFVSSGAARRPRAVLGLIGIAAMASAMSEALPGRAATFAPLFLAFALGMGAHLFRDRIVLRPILAILMLPLVAVLPWPLAVGLLGYACLAVALKASDVVLPGDFSYGVYIYGWPVAQLLVHAHPGIAPGTLALVSFAATLLFAIASWYLVEQPLLTRSRLRA
jgi:peptidoglycan/LPS O-acetylase OafA/YrhL